VRLGSSLRFERGESWLDQRVDALDVEVVGRLVEQQHVRAERGEGGEGDPRLLPTREVSDLKLVRHRGQPLGAELVAHLRPYVAGGCNRGWWGLTP